MMRRPIGWIALGCAVIVGLGIFAGRDTLESGSVKSQGAPSSVDLPSAQAAQAGSVAESLEQAFIRVGREVGPAVVSISTEQIEQVQRYFRVHPFFGQEPFDDFFRDFFGEMPQQREFKRFGLGSGVIIDERGFILTNDHVVADADKITVTLADGRELSGQVKGKDARSDLAVIKVDAKRLPVARLGDSDSLKTGQWALALGNPFGLVHAASPQQALGPEPTLTVGVISALHRQLPRPARSDRDYSDLVQTDAAINPGNSGGPLVNLAGEVIGINVAILTSSRGFEGVGFAIPINKAKGVLDALIEGRKVLYGWLGIQIQDITQDVAEYYGLADREGVLVYQVLADSPAQAAGVKDGDIVKVFDGKAVKTSRELIDLVGRTKVGRRASIEILREKQRLSLNVEIGERPSQTELVEGGGESWRGLRVAQIVPQLAERFGLPEDARGVVVTDVDPASAAADARVQPGDVINEINRMPIESLNDYRQAIAKVQGNALVRTNRGYVVIKAGQP
jgi:serine protease Do